MWQQQQGVAVTSRKKKGARIEEEGRIFKKGINTRNVPLSSLYRQQRELATRRASMLRYLGKTLIIIIITIIVYRRAATCPYGRLVGVWHFTLPLENRYTHNTHLTSTLFDRPVLKRRVPLSTSSLSFSLREVPWCHLQRSADRCRLHICDLGHFVWPLRRQSVNCGPALLCSRLTA